MDRRTLVKTLGLSAIGLATVPLWIDSWTAEALPTSVLHLGEKEKNTLAALVGVIIPGSDIPGAKELEVDKFVVTMVADCYEEDVQNNFLSGFEKLNNNCEEKHGKIFLKLTGPEQLAICEEISAQPVPAEGKFNFINFVKDLTITGYMTSEYVMENIVGYEFVPSRFNGSYPVEKSIKTI